jgi:predicted Holliday junction resolvase-like endonuclease
MRYRFVWGCGIDDIIFDGMTRAEVEEVVVGVESMAESLHQPVRLLMVEELPEVEA